MKKVLMTFLVFLFITAPATAKEGFYIGPEIVFNDIGGQVNSEHTIASGNGLGIKGGFGFNRNVSVETAFWMTAHDVAGGRTADLRGFTLDMKMTFPIVNSHIEPYLLAGIGKYRLDSSRGNGWNLGAGIDVYLFPWLNFNVGLTRRIIDFGTAPKVSGEVTSMDIGFVYHLL
jgi:hypothetical protein